MEPHWVVLYDATADGSAFVFPFIGLILVALALVAVRRKTFTRDAYGETIVQRGSRRARLFLAFATAWFLTASAMVLGFRHQLVKALESGGYTEVVGIVHEFSEADPLRRRPESWRVGEHSYQLQDAQFGRGMHSTGLVREGMHVRISDVDGAIARLEVER